MMSTLLSTILNRMSRYQVASTTGADYQTRDLDEAIRRLERIVEVPWRLKKSTLKVFSDVLVYPVASDHAHLAYVDNPLNSDQNANITFDQRARFKNTSLQQFYENPDYRNDIVQIWDQGTQYLGVRYNQDLYGSSLIGQKVLANYTASGDASALATDTVVFLEDNSSIRFTVTSSSGTATIVEVPTTSFSDTNYKRKYFFRWIYLSAVPTSIDLRFGTNSTNYMSQTTITTQFSGQAFKANDWNLVAFDLNNPTSTTGTITSTSFDYNAIILHGAATGTYYLDNSYVRDWTLMDYWYYSTYNCLTNGATTPDQKYFYNSSDTYSTDTSLVGDDEWVDVIMYDALVSTLVDKENDRVAKLIEAKRQEAWDTLLARYPSMSPLITTNNWNFQTDYNNNGTYNR